MKKLLVLLLAVGCASPSAQPPADTSATTPATTSQPTRHAVEVLPVLSRPLEATTHLEGELAPLSLVDLRARANGFVGKVLVDRGSVVKRGQLLVTVVAPELAAQRAEIEAKLAAEQSTLSHLRKASQTPGVVAEHELELAEGSVHVDESRVTALRELEGYLSVVAPFAGVVTERNVHPGALVGPQLTAAPPMLHLEQVDHLRLTVAVPEQLVGEIAQGASAQFSVRAWPGRSFTGTIQRLSRSVDTRTRSMPVELDVDNADGALAPGMFADVVWPVHRAAPALLVPPSAIVQSTDGTYVVRVDDGKVTRVKVERGSSVGDLLEVFGALQPGALVVRRATEELRPGAVVETKVVTPATETKPP
ncbi:MAG TPA: efflux RND transporter periplasmic adaptor subunit [Polyangiales bacterium]